jgi:outer membrane lipoprotein-sorting protein
MAQQRLVATCLLASALLVTSVPAADLFDEIYARGKPIDATLRTLTAQFSETTESPLLTEPLVAQGTIAVVRPARVAMHYSVPDRRSLIIDGGHLRVIWPARALDRTTPIGSIEKRIQRYFVDTSPKQLRGHFDVAAEVASDRPGSWFVSMTPKRKQVAEGLSRLDLWIRRDDVMLAAMRMVFPDGDTKLLEFSEVRINPAIDDSVFREMSRY